MSIRKIKDGLTKTIMFGEMRAGLSEVDPRGCWAMGTVGSSVHYRHASNRTISPNSCNPGDDDVANATEIVADVGEQVLQQNCMFVEINWNHSAQSVMRSTHQGGINVCMCDGSVRFLSDFIDTGQQIGGVDDSPENFRTWQRLNVSQDSLPIMAAY